MRFFVDDDTTPQTSTISAVVKDENGFPFIDNTVIKFSAVNRDTREPIGIIEPFGLTQTLTVNEVNLQGVAQVPFTANFESGIAEITATDSSGEVEGTVFVTILADIDFDDTCVDMPDATLDEEYLYDFRDCIVGTQETGPYTFTLLPDIAGNPPLGLELSEEGIMFGIPTEEGVFIFAVEVTDSFGNRAFEVFTLEVVTPEGELAISPESGTFSDGVTASLVFTVEGGIGEYSWSLNTRTVEPASAFSIISVEATATVTYDGTAITTPGSMAVTVTSGESQIVAEITVN